ncbi:MAG: hypothetical protein GY870_11730 [archaeon]|nr:hypothetical protein [archaeon]
MSSKNSELPIAIACRLDKENALELTGKIINYFIEKKVKIVLESRIAQRFRFIGKMELRQMTENTVKLIISIGGDGTILRVAQNLPRRKPTPLLGINIDSVGFLDEVDIEKNSLYKILDQLRTNDYTIERSVRLATYYNQKRLPDALNEVLCITSNPSKVLHVALKIDNEFFNTGYLDGVIVSTSVGSTAYCLSAGGSLIDPKLKTIQIVPVNPFARSGNLKPIVIPSSSKVEIELVRPKLNALIIIDGQTEYKAFPKTKIEIKKSESDLKFVRLNNSINTFYYKLRTKILAGVPVPKEDSPEE